MGEFLDVTLSRVPPGMELPEPLLLLFARVEDQRNVVRGQRIDDLFGLLSPDPKVGTAVELRGFPPAEHQDYVRSWFGDMADDPTKWLWPFCRTGFDGSYAALWLDVDGVTRIVHLGSGSGSLLTCVLAEDPVDFLRLLAIGYQEICWHEDWLGPPVAEDDHEPLNQPFRDWVTSTFGVTIPGTGAEIVPEPAEMGDQDTTDPFTRLVNNLT